MTTSYKEKFTAPSSARNYEQRYAPETADDLLWQVEQTHLNKVISQLREKLTRIDYLDFACGTGRIISFVEPQVDSATGIEISPEMVRIAQKYVKDASLQCRDITSEDAEIENKYDLITTYRFILNAEPALRVAGFKALAARLKDQSSRLVFSNHGNPWSYKALMWPVHFGRQLLFGKKREGNYLTRRQTRAVLDAAGLEIVDVTGVGFISAKIVKLLPFSWCQKTEATLAGKPLLQRLGVNQLYVCKLKARSP
ncbi:MAG: methyltransferase domain-containing protein [Gammaproteobacteria bacterium]|nr:methyltransferase domain-containing protein [Gammaproteobacteria bacterium]NNL50598.1 methyltransferase domain-containing protein [Woeseiaceae bacterium]